MAEFYVKRRLEPVFEAADDESYEIVKNFKVNEVYKAKIWKPRNLDNHRRYIVLIYKVVFPNLPDRFKKTFPNEESLRKEIIYRSGYYKMHTTIKGKQFPVVDSIKFENMDEIKFKELFSKSIDVIIKHFLPGNTEEELKNEVQRILDFA
jgi:hypothetical protein